MVSSNMLSVLEHCKVTPPPGTVTPKSLPLTFFDLPWLQFSLRHVFFYEFPHSKDYFLQIAIPKLKHSLSITLQHYYPLAGKLIISPNSGRPEIRYADGDYLSLIFAESSNDFDHLAGNHERVVDELESLVPDFPPKSSLSTDTLVAQLMAIQVTYFPNIGISFGFTIHHTAGDANSIFNFFKSWALISKGGDSTKLASSFLPCHDRSVVKDPYGLESIYWNQLQSRKSKEGQSQPQSQPHSSPHTIRATFLMSQDIIPKLKKIVSNHSSNTSHVSTYTVTCGYLWSCIVRAKAASNKTPVDENDMERFIFSMNCRGLLDPPIPNNYFGNCTVPCIANVKSSLMMEKESFIAAAKAIGEAIQERKNKEGGILHGEEQLFSRLGTLNMKRLSTISGSPKFGTYEVDFGWGRPKKSEILPNEGTISLDVRTDGDLEVGISLPHAVMDAFASVFTNGLALLA